MKKNILLTLISLLSLILSIDAFSAVGPIETETVPETTIKNWGVKVDNAQYYDYVEFYDQGRLVDKYHIIIAESEGASGSGGGDREQEDSGFNETTVQEAGNVTETTKKNWGVKVDNAQYYDYVEYDDQGRIVEKNNIVIAEGEGASGSGGGSSGQGGYSNNSAGNSNKDISNQKDDTSGIANAQINGNNIRYNEYQQRLNESVRQAEIARIKQNAKNTANQVRKSANIYSETTSIRYVPDETTSVPISNNNNIFGSMPYRETQPKINIFESVIDENVNIASENEIISSDIVESELISSDEINLNESIEESKEKELLESVELREKTVSTADNNVNVSTEEKKTNDTNNNFFTNVLNFFKNLFNVNKYPNIVLPKLPLFVNKYSNSIEVLSMNYDIAKQNTKFKVTFNCTVKKITRGYIGEFNFQLKDNNNYIVTSENKWTNNFKNVLVGDIVEQKIVFNNVPYSEIYNLIIN